MDNCRFNPRIFHHTFSPMIWIYQVIYSSILCISASNEINIVTPKAFITNSIPYLTDLSHPTTFEYVSPTTGRTPSKKTLEEKALLKTRLLDTPKLQFLADDYEAASKIPDYLTAYFDNKEPTQIKPLYDRNLHGNIYPEDKVGQIKTTIAEFPATDPTDIELPGGNEVASGRADLKEGTYRGHKNFFSSRPHSILNQYPPRKDFHSNANTFSRNGNLGIANMTRVSRIEAECENDYMKILIQFNGTFEGMIYSSGYSHDQDCVYVSGSGNRHYEFFIKLNRCGTLSTNENIDTGQPLSKNVMWNTLTVQYNPLIEEEWDEHFKVTCEYGLEIWKTVTFPFLDVEVQPGNPMTFTLNPPECHMEIRYGFDLRGREVAGPVRVGEPLTLVIYMQSEYDGFDIIVSDCYAHNGGTKKIKLIDSYGCPVDEKLISHFEGETTKNSLFETRVFAFMKTFRFTGSPALYLECSIRMCHGECPMCIEDSPRRGNALGCVEINESGQPMLVAAIGGMVGNQPCHWRERSGVRLRRSADNEKTVQNNVSDSLHLFHSIQVVREDEPNKRPLVGTSDEAICIGYLNFFLAAGMAAAILVLTTTTCVVMCIRVRRFRKDVNYPTLTKECIMVNRKSEFVPPIKRRLE